LRRHYPCAGTAATKVTEAKPRTERQPSLNRADDTTPTATIGTSSSLRIARCITGLINEARQFKEHLDALLVINRKIVNTAIGRDVAGALAGFGFPVCTAALHQRVVFAESAAQGLAVIEAAPASEAAIESEPWRASSWRTGRRGRRHDQDDPIQNGATSLGRAMGQRGRA
jgi:hypothetical protein